MIWIDEERPARWTVVNARPCDQCVMNAVDIGWESTQFPVTLLIKSTKHLKRKFSYVYDLKEVLFTKFHKGEKLPKYFSAGMWRNGGPVSLLLLILYSPFILIAAAYSFPPMF